MSTRPFPENPKTSKSRTRILVLTLCLSGSCLLLLVFVAFLLYLYFSHCKHPRTNPFDENSPLKLQRFSYKELKSATKGFDSSNLVGKGGSGTVFRGILRDGKYIAVKKLNLSCLRSDREFQNELQVLGGLRSPFIVSLLGFCVDQNRRFLVYEFMPNRSLQEVLFGESCDRLVLNWDKRFEIILNIARGLEFLHLKCDPPVIHGDIKPSNVLLGEDFQAKISDFGLSRIKTEDDLSVNFFSQDLTGTVAEIQNQEILGEASSDVDISPALQASSSSTKMNWKNEMLKKSNSYSSSNTEDFVKNLKGKEVAMNKLTMGVRGNLYLSENSKELIVDTEKKQWRKDYSKFVFWDNLICSSEHSKDSIFDQPNKKKIWGKKDWWCKQDNGGVLSSKDYVMQWMTRQPSPSRNLDWNNERRNSPNKTDFDATVKGFKSENVEDNRLEAFNFNESEVTEKNEALSSINPSSKRRKMQEWWREEYFSEISKKTTNKQTKLNLEPKKGFKFSQFDLSLSCGQRQTGVGGDYFADKKKKSLNFDLSFRKRWKMNCNSVDGEILSGDMFSKELSSATSMRGTICYVAPEYGGCGYLLEKSDVYSFGVLILVLVSGKRPLDVLSSSMNIGKANLISWCRNLAQTGNVLDLVDEKLHEEFNRDQAVLCINLALICLQKQPESRPDVGEILRILKGKINLPSPGFEFSPLSKMFRKS